MRNLGIRQGVLKDLKAMKALFYDTISTVNAKDYTIEQIKVWRKSVENEERWFALVKSQYVLVAELEDKIVGFISLKDDQYIDFLYVHKDYQGQKVANQLYLEIEKRVNKLGGRKLESDVSITAKPFFERRGFEVIKENIVVREGLELRNYKMGKVF